MNPLYSPKTSDNGLTRVDYFSKQKVSQRPASAIMAKLLATMCGNDLGENVPELFGELEELLEQNQVDHDSSVHRPPPPSPSPAPHPPLPLPLPWV